MRCLAVSTISSTPLYSTRVQSSPFLQSLSFSFLFLFLSSALVLRFSSTSSSLSVSFVSACSDTRFPSHPPSPASLAIRSIAPSDSLLPLPSFPRSRSALKMSRPTEFLTFSTRFSPSSSSSSRSPLPPPRTSLLLTDTLEAPAQFALSHYVQRALRPSHGCGTAGGGGGGGGGAKEGGRKVVLVGVSEREEYWSGLMRKNVSSVPCLQGRSSSSFDETDFFSLPHRAYNSLPRPSPSASPLSTLLLPPFSSRSSTPLSSLYSDLLPPPRHRILAKRSDQDRL